MTPHQILTWFPRILAILFTLFISLFALDVFNEPQWGVALLMHLIPTLIALAITTISWRYPGAGGVLWLVAAALLFGLTSVPLLIINLPIITLGTLFLASAFLKAKKHAQH